MKRVFVRLTPDIIFMSLYVKFHIGSKTLTFCSFIFIGYHVVTIYRQVSASVKAKKVAVRTNGKSCKPLNLKLRGHHITAEETHINCSHLIVKGIKCEYTKFKTLTLCI